MAPFVLSLVHLWPTHLPPLPARIRAASTYAQTEDEIQQQQQEQEQQQAAAEGKTGSPAVDLDETAWTGTGPSRPVVTKEATQTGGLV